MLRAVGTLMRCASRRGRVSYHVLQSPRRQVARARVKLAIQAGLTIALVVLLVQRTDLSEVSRVLADLDVAWIVALAGIMLLFAMASAVRWYRVLISLGERVPFRSLLADTLVGMTYNMLLPTTSGGDVIRALRCGRKVSRTHRAWSSVLYERVAGLCAMALVGAVAIAVAGAPRLGTLRWIVLGSALILTVLFMYLSGPFRVLLALLRRRSPGPPDFLAGMARDLDGRLAMSGPRAEVMAWSTACVALGFAYSIASALSLGVPEAVVPLLLGLPVIFIGSMVPVTISGLGLREGLFVVVLGQLGVDRAVALAIAVQALLGLLFLALVGLVVLAGERLEGSGTRRSRPVL